MSQYIRMHLKLDCLVTESSGVRLKDLDRNELYDLTGSYGMNVFGNDFYKECIEAGIQKVRKLGPVLGPYHPLIEENVQKLTGLSGLDEVSFHMSGTEAVMQAVRLARYHTGRSYLVRFCGAYHGWWDGVQPGVGNPRKVNDVYTLKELDEYTLRVLDSRRDIACVLVNPLQALHPNASAPADGMLVNSERAARMDYDAYRTWLAKLRRVCTERNIVLILDEVFVGFRIAYRGAQEYFNVRADLVTYGKTLGGGLPVGVVCGKSALMKRFRQDRPMDICFARGTFNSHPYVMGSMNEFLHRTELPEMQRRYENLDSTWNLRAQRMNQQLVEAEVPIRVANLSSIFTVVYTQPSRYNWMLQFYLRAAGLMLGWVGTGRLIFSLNYSERDFDEVTHRLVSAARSMKEDGWWWQHTQTTNQSIKRQVLMEMLKSRFSR
jgi:glutamate-1-semialdehyde 2,1-aminomutase